MDSGHNDGMRRGMEPSAETVYGTHEDNTMVMSEKVRSSLLHFSWAISQKVF